MKKKISAPLVKPNLNNTPNCARKHHQMRTIKDSCGRMIKDEKICRTRTKTHVLSTPKLITHSVKIRLHQQQGGHGKVLPSPSFVCL